MAQPGEGEITLIDRTCSPVISRFPWLSKAVGGGLDIRTFIRSSHCLSGFLTHLGSFERHTLLNPKSKAGLDYRHTLELTFVNRELYVKPPPKRNPQQWSTLVSLLFAYRLGDIVVITEAEQPSPPTPIPRTLKVGPKAPLPHFNKLGDWTALLRAFKASYIAERDRVQTLFTDNSPLRLVKTVARCGSQGNLCNISANLFTAALHLSYLMHHEYQEGQLPELTNNFDDLVAMRLGSQKKGLGHLTKDEIAYWETVVGTANERNTEQGSTTTGRERQPLLLALAVSASYLLVPYQLTQAPFGGENLISTSVALGNLRPPLLMKVDKVIWGVLFQIAAEAISPEEGLDLIIKELPWDEISSCTQEERGWFKLAKNTPTPVSTEPIAAPPPCASTPLNTLSAVGAHKALFTALAEEESDNDMDTQSDEAQIQAALREVDAMDDAALPSPRHQSEAYTPSVPGFSTSASLTTPNHSSPSVTSQAPSGADVEMRHRQSQSPSPACPPSETQNANPTDMAVDDDEEHRLEEHLSSRGKDGFIGDASLEREELLTRRENVQEQEKLSDDQDPDTQQDKTTEDAEMKGKPSSEVDEELSSSEDKEMPSDDEGNVPQDEVMKDTGDEEMRDRANKGETGVNTALRTSPQGREKSPPTSGLAASTQSQTREPRTRGQAAAAAEADAEVNAPRTRGQTAAAAKADAETKAKAALDLLLNAGGKSKPSKPSATSRATKKSTTPPRIPPPPPPVTPASLASVGDKRKQPDDTTVGPDPKRPKPTLGSRPNPIDVDAYALLNPTQTARRNPAKSELKPTLSSPTARYTTAKPFEVLDGKLEKRKVFPHVHNREELLRLEHVWQSVTNSYIDGKPLLEVRPDKSIFRVISHAEREKLGHSGVQKILARQCLIVTDVPSKEMHFDKNGLRSLAPLDSVVQFQDLSLPPPTSNMSDRLVFGRVSQLLESAQAPETLRKALNGLSFPMASSGSDVLEPHASCGVAWTNTSVSLFKAEVGRPSADTNWGLAATEGAITQWHLDTNGFGTRVNVRTGSKLWIASSNAREELAKIGSFLTEGFELDEPPRNFSTEAILLTPGTELYMIAGIAHLVYTPDNTICHGSHFYSTSFMQTTLASYIHGFISHTYLTNISHPKAQVLFRRLIHFYHRGLILKIDLTDDEAAHLPDLLQRGGESPAIDDVMNFISLCVLNLLSSALDQRTYEPPGAQEGKRPSAAQRKVMEGSDANSIDQLEREEMIEARGVSLEAFAWFRKCFDVRLDGKAGSVDLVSTYIVQVARRLLRYKRVALVNGVKSASTFGTEELELQVEAALKLDPRSWKLWATEHQGRWFADDLKSTSMVKLGPRATFGVGGFVELDKEGEEDVAMEEGEIRPAHDRRLSTTPLSFVAPFEVKDFKWKEESFLLDHASSYRVSRNSAAFLPGSKKWTETGATALDRNYRDAMEWLRVETAEKIRSRWDAQGNADVKPQR